MNRSQTPQQKVSSSGHRNPAGLNTGMDKASRGKRGLTAAVLLLLATATMFAIAVMGPRLVREGALLWFGTETTGIVRNAAIQEVGKFKGGAPKYRLTLDYTFAVDGTEIAGTSVRNDIRTPPSLAPGDPIGVFYEAGDPHNSVAEHNLRIDVYALLLFLPFLALIGFGLPLFFLLPGRAARAPR